MKLSIKWACISALAFSLFMSCEKAKDGAPGAPGAVGPQGPSGNSNVIFHTSAVNSWSSNSSRWYANLSAPELTSNTINSASVQVYLGLGNDVWRAIPTTQLNSFGNYYMGFVTAVNTVEVFWDYNNSGIGDNPNIFYGVVCQFKVVIIPSSAIKAYPNLDLKDYNAVKEIFKLKE